MTTYRAGVIGLGRMGWLYDASLPYPPSVRDEDGTTTELPPLRDHPDLPPTEHPGKEGLPTSYAAALRLHPRTELVAGCDPSEERLAAFGKYHGVKALYTDYPGAADHGAAGPGGYRFPRRNSPGRTTALAVECGAKAVMTEKPMTLTLAEADRMVEVCGQAGVPLACGAISVNHPAFAQARKLLTDGTIGTILSMETSRAMAQHNAWVYLMDGPAEWVIGVTEDEEAVRAERGVRGPRPHPVRQRRAGVLATGRAAGPHHRRARGADLRLEALSAVAGRGRADGYDARGDAVSGAAGVGAVVNPVRRRGRDPLPRTGRRATGERAAGPRCDGDRDRAARIASGWQHQGGAAPGGPARSAWCTTGSGRGGGPHPPAPSPPSGEGE